MMLASLLGFRVWVILRSPRVQYHTMRGKVSDDVLATVIRNQPIEELVGQWFVFRFRTEERMGWTEHHVGLVTLVTLVIATFLPFVGLVTLVIVAFHLQAVSEL